MANGDEQKIDFTVADRVQAATTAKTVDRLCEKIDDLRKFLHAHAEQHTAEQKANNTQHKDFVRKSFLWKTLKLFALATGISASAAGVYATVVGLF